MAILAIIGAFLHGDGRWLHWLAKPTTTLLIAAITWRVCDPAQPFYRAVLAGMLLSCVGDIALMLPMDAFVPGLVAFLLAPLPIVAFRDGLRAGRGCWRPACCWRLCRAQRMGLWPHLPPMRIPVLAYVVVLASMAVLALARRWRRPQPAAVEASSARWAAAGALLFVASDSLLAWDRFAGGLPLASLLVLHVLRARSTPSPAR
jgi:uncharacterized membrane protein YhhN